MGWPTEVCFEQAAVGLWARTDTIRVMASQGSFAIRPLIPDGATVRALNILKAADLLVDTEWVHELLRRPVTIGGEARRVAGSHDPTMEVHLDEPLQTAIAWGVLDCAGRG